MTVQMTLILYTATPRSVIRSSAPTVFNRRLVVVYTKYSDASPGVSVASKNGVDDAGNKTGEQVSCRLHNDRRKPLSSLRHWYRPIRVRIPATNRAVAAKIRMMGKKTGTMEMSSTGSACYTVFRPAAAFG